MHNAKLEKNCLRIFSAFDDDYCCGISDHSRRNKYALGKPVTVSAISSGTAESLTDGVTNQTTGDNVWSVSATKAPGAYADVELGLSEINRMVIYHGMNSRHRAVNQLCSTVF